MTQETASQRVFALDAVRGLALLGVLIVNVDSEFRGSPFERFAAASDGEVGWNALAGRLIASGLTLKPLILFSFLFGLGIASQQARRLGAGSPFVPFILRRLLFLMGLGLLHYVFAWSGDVLLLYALVALLALPALRLSQRALVGVGLAFLALHVVPLPFPRAFASQEAMDQSVLFARAVYGHGGYWQTVLFRLEEWRPALAISAWSIPRTLGLFLLGMAAARAEGLTGANSRANVGRVATAALTVGVAAELFLATTAPHGVVLAGVEAAADLGFAFGAGGILFLIAGAPSLEVWVRWLASLGRMTLTAYLAQSVVLGFVFYGYGLGWYGQVNHLGGLAIALALFVAQAAFATRWFGRAKHREGPLEGIARRVSTQKLGRAESPANAMRSEA